MNSANGSAGAARGDFQTPVELARAIWKLLPEVDAVIEPTVGTGSFLRAAPVESRRLPWRCFDLSPQHVATTIETARRLGFGDASIIEKDAFALSPADFAHLSPDTRVLAVGNPPWVTSAGQAAASQVNLPEKRNRFGLKGLEALTGRANFDIAEAVLVTLLEALRAHSEVHLAFLMKRSAALRLARQLLGRPGYERFCFASIETRRHFGVGVEAGLLQFRRTATESSTNRVLLATRLGAAASSHAGLVAGHFVEDLEAYKSVAHLEARGNALVWRQGIKHDVARVLELKRRADGRLVNGYGELVDIEEESLYPFWKGADLAIERGPSRLFPLYQETLAGPVRGLETRWPKLAEYLKQHRLAFAARRSRIYQGKGPYALFGVGKYLLAPYKVAVSGLHRRPRFCLLRPLDGRPSLIDDTSYLLPFTTEREAAVVCGFLGSDPVTAFLSCLVDRFAKRPYTKAVLERVRLPTLEELPSDLADLLAASVLSDAAVPTDTLLTWLHHWQGDLSYDKTPALQLFAA